MNSEDGSAVITTQDIYRVLIQVRDDVQVLAQESRTSRDRIEDHERRLREIESHGSTNAQELATEMTRTRERLHGLEGSSALHGAFIAEHAEEIKQAATKERVEHLEELLKGTRSTLLKVAMLALSVAATAVATLVIALLI